MAYTGKCELADFAQATDDIPKEWKRKRFLRQS